jgi:hypothetical protein
MVIRLVMDSMAVIIWLIWSSVVLDKLRGFCCNGAKMFIVGFLQV